MSRLNEREIARKLAEREELEPPAGLLDKIKSEIPTPLQVVNRVEETERRSPMPMTQRWLIAASLVATVGAGLFAMRVHEQSPSMGVMAPSRQAESPAAPAPAPQDRASGTREGFVGQSVPKRSQPSLRPKAPASTRLEEKDVQALRALGYVASAPEPQPAPPPPPPPPPAVDLNMVTKREAAAPKPDEEITVTAESPLLDERRISTGATVTQKELENIPTARDPWTVLQKTPGVLTGRVNVGGNESGQQGAYAGPGNQGDKASPAYYDFDSFEEMKKTAKPKDKEEPAARKDDLFKSKAVNPFVETAKDRLSTFGLDVDTASYTVARQFLNSGTLPVPAAIRVEEMVNFFDYGDPTPKSGDFAIKAEGAPTPFTQGPQYRLVRFNLRGREVRMDNRRPVVLTFLIDASGSMEQPNRLPLVKQSLSLLIDQLRPTDQIGLVIFGDRAHVLLEPTNDREAVRKAIDQVAIEGATNLEDGLTVAYEVAGRHLQPNVSNRIVLCSDGGANIGHEGPQAILGQIGREARRGIELTTLGFGMDGYNDNLMEQLADKGDGRYAYIDTIGEAKRVLVEEVSGTLNTIAKDAKTQVEFNPAVVARYRLLGYENRAIADERFRDNRVIAGQIGSGHSVTALYEVELKPDAPRDGLVGTLRLRYRTPVVGNVTETEKRLYLYDLAATWEKASPAFRLSALVAQFAEILKGSPWAKGNLGEVARQVQEAQKALPKSAASGRFNELAELAGKAAKIQKEKK